jgi:hypothetical protein
MLPSYFGRSLHLTEPRIIKTAPSSGKPHKHRSSAGKAIDGKHLALKIKDMFLCLIN